MVTKNNTVLKTMKIEQDIHKALTKLGSKGDTFSNIIRRLLVQRRDLEDALKSLGKEDRLRVEEKIKKKWEDSL